MLQAPTPETKNSSEASRSSVPAEPEHVLHPRHGTLQNPYANGTPSDSRSPHLATHLQRHISGLHRTLGNQAVLHLLSHRAPALQTKLTINQPGDQYEQEADHVADHVMRMPDPAGTVADSSSPSASFSGSASVASFAAQMRLRGLHRGWLCLPGVREKRTHAFGCGTGFRRRGSIHSA